MIPHIIHQIYFGTIPREMQAYMDTAHAVNPDWEVKLWTDENIGFLGVDYPSLLEKFKAPVHVTDYIRLLVIHHFGGIYLDSDVECVRPFDGLCEFDAVAATQDGTGQICPATFGACAKHPWVMWQLDNVLKYSRPNEPWNVGLMTDTPREGLTLVPTDTFYPWLWTTPKDERKITDRTLSVHHWKGSWAPWVIRDRT